MLSFAAHMFFSSFAKENGGCSSRNDKLNIEPLAVSSAIGDGLFALWEDVVASHILSSEHTFFVELQLEFCLT